VETNLELLKQLTDALLSNWNSIKFDPRLLTDEPLKKEGDVGYNKIQYEY